MLIVECHNITKGEDLTYSDYQVVIRINNERILWRGEIKDFARGLGAAELIRLVADTWDDEEAGDAAGGVMP